MLESLDEDIQSLPLLTPQFSASGTSVFGSATTTGAFSQPTEYLAKFYAAIDSEDCPGSVDLFCVSRVVFQKDSGSPTSTDYQLRLDFDPLLSSSSGVSVVTVWESPPTFSGEPIIARGGMGTASVVPIPAAAWLFGSALLGLGVVKRRKA